MEQGLLKVKIIIVALLHKKYKKSVSPQRDTLT